MEKLVNAVKIKNTKDMYKKLCELVSTTHLINRYRTMPSHQRE